MTMPQEEKSDWTLEDYVISLFKARKTDSHEFKAILAVYGREKLAAIWEKYKNERGLKD